MTEHPSPLPLEDACKANGIYEEVIRSLLQDGSIVDVPTANVQFVGVHRYKHVGQQGLETGVDLVVAATGRTGVRNNLLFPLEEGKPFASSGEPIQPDQFETLMSYAQNQWTQEQLLTDSGVLEKLHRAYQRKQIDPVQSRLRVTNLSVIPKELGDGEHELLGVEIEYQDACQQLLMDMHRLRPGDGFDERDPLLRFQYEVLMAMARENQF